MLPSSLARHGLVLAALLLTLSAHAEQTQNPPSCPVLKELSFTSDFPGMTDHKTDHKDGGNPYVKPDWTKGGKNNPIVHGMGKKISLTVTYTCDATNIGTYTVEGTSGTAKTLHFGPKQATFVVGDNVVALTAEDPLPSAIDDNAGGSITWTLKPGSCKETTGPHQIYVTADAPYGSQTTEWRIAYVTKLCDGLTTGDDCCKKIHDSTATYTLGAKPPILWAIAVGTKGECIDLAKFYKLGMQMLGWRPAGDLMFIYALTGKSAKATAGTADHQRRADGKILGFEDKGGGRNHWEATLLYNGKYYAGGAGIYASPLECMTAICKQSIWGFPVEVAEVW